MESSLDKIRILCVDDNPLVAEALKRKLCGMEQFEWAGWLSRADPLPQIARSEKPSIVLLDLDMPGEDSLSAATRMLESTPDIRLVVFTSHVRSDLIDEALEAGAWGYASKHDGEDELVSVLRSVAAGEVVFSPGVWAVYARE